MSSARQTAALVASLLGLSLTSTAPGYGVTNYTGLPVFPSLSRASMDDVSKTDKLGRWCSRFVADTSYPLEKVEDWYRKALRQASETNLADDAVYKAYANLSGIKLAVGIDYVTVFRIANQPGTSIELFKCSPPDGS